MPVIQITDIVARTAKPSDTQITYWDKTLPNFGLRVGRRAKAWVVLLGPERRRVTIGRYPAMSVQDARSKARRLLVSAIDVRRDGSIVVVPFTVALERFVSLHVAQKKASTAKSYERSLRKYFVPAWNGLLMHEITRAQVMRVVDKLMEKKRSEANDAFAAVRVFVRWSVRRGYLAHNPMELLAMPVRYAPRDRVLSRDEIKAVLGACSGGDWAFGTIVLLLLLTGQRRGEIGGLRSEWIDRENGLLTLPKEITKNKQGHVLPLTPYVLKLLPRREGLLFPARGEPDCAFNGWSKCMDALRKACQVRDFRLHDLRRTAATMMASLGVPPHVIERILNHITGSTSESITSLGRIYNRHRYLDEMRGALMVWEAEVLRLLAECRPDVPLPDAGFEPGEDLALDPADAARPELDAFGEAAGFLEAVDMSGRVED